MIIQLDKKNKKNKRKISNQLHRTYKSTLGTKLSNLTNVKKTKYSVHTFRSVYGINRVSSWKLNSLLGHHPHALQKDINVRRVVKMLTKPNVFIDFQLRRIVFRRMALLVRSRSYRGFRLLHGLPCRGQRTKSNARTPARMLASKRYLPFVLTKPRYLLEDFIANQRKKKKKKGIRGHIRVFKKGKKAQLSKTKAKKIRKLRELKKKVKRKNALKNNR